MNMDSYPREKREPRHLTPRSNKSIKHGVSGTKRYNRATESQIHKLAKDKGWRTPKRQYININRIDL